MTTILALETSGALCSVAVRGGTEPIEHTRNVERLHNEVVLAMVDDICRRAAIAPQMLDVVAFGAGPGSFTGIRLAASVAQGIAFAAGALVVPVCSSLAMAHCALGRLTSPPSLIVTMTRSRRDTYYLAGYSVQQDQVSVLTADVLCTDWPSEFLGRKGVAVGERPPWWEPRREPAVGKANLLGWGGNVEVTAGVIADLGLRAYHAGDGMAPEAGVPIYVAGDSPWQRLSGA